MPFLRSLVRDRRVQLALLLAVSAVLISRYALPEAIAVRVVVKAGYWALFFVFGLFAVVVARVVRSEWTHYQRSRADLGVLAVLVLTGSVLLSHERYGYKILADEVLLVGTSMGMHYERDVAYPIRATDVQGPFQILQNVIDKRPFFFPFLVSIVHDLTGYRPENAFYLNTALGFVFLCLLYFLGLKIGRSRWAGMLVVLLFAGLPLLSQQMKGGGFELLNLIMLASVLLFGLRHAEQRTAASQELFVYAAVLLAFTRYESILLLVPVAALVVWGWWREQRVIVSWPTIVAPAFLFFPLLQNRVFAFNSGAWELGSRGATAPFGLQYLSNNLVHALAFFFDTTGYQPNSPFFAALGLLACPFFVVWMIRVARGPDPRAPQNVALAVLGLGLFAIWALLMVYFWGLFDDPVIHRLSLPVHLLFAVAILVVCGSMLKSDRGWKMLCSAAAVALVVYSLPMMSRRAYAATYSPAAEMEWRSDFLRRFPEHDYLFLDYDSVFWITHHIPATSTTQAQARKEGLIYHLRNDTFSSMYVMQHFRIDPKTGERKLEPQDDIGSDFELETVWEKRIQTLFIGRISRVKAIRENGEVAARQGPVVTPPSKEAAARSGAEWEAAKKAYVENWLKKLP